ncbi:MAG: hypothetical protein FWE06_00315 [Oscillospiraceae bacterium]|nr:hypothetical protein [Oscillospiraceae bacterium]
MMDELFDLQPLKSYMPPSLPTLDAGKLQLHKLPSRWQKNAAVIVCAGVLGLSVLTGCVGSRDEQIDPPYIGYVDYSALEVEWDVQFTYGGGGPIPHYVVQLTEQEALNIIRAHLETAGLNFDAVPLEGMDLFDADRDVGITYVSAGGDFADAVRNWWAAHDEDIVVGVFYNRPSELFEEISSERVDGEEVFAPPSEAEIDRARPFVYQALVQQIRDFVTQLRADGVL